MRMSAPEDDGFFEEDEPVDEILERFARGEKGLTCLPPGGQVLPSPEFLAIWPRSGHYAPDEEALVQA